MPGVHGYVTCVCMCVRVLVRTGLNVFGKPSNRLFLYKRKQSSTVSSTYNTLKLIKRGFKQWFRVLYIYSATDHESTTDFLK